MTPMCALWISCVVLKQVHLDALSRSLKCSFRQVSLQVLSRDFKWSSRRLNLNVLPKITLKPNRLFDQNVSGTTGLRRSVFLGGGYKLGP